MSRVLYRILLMLCVPLLLQGADPLTATKLTHLKFEQNLGAQISMDPPFVEDTGKPITLKDCFTSGPVILTLGYYQCPMLCNLTLNGIVQALQEIKAPEGVEVTLVFVSIDPAEAPSLASAKKQTYLKRFGRSDASHRWHFLTGKAASIQRLAQEAGFTYAYDPATAQYAHPSGIVVLTPEGRISHYFFGVNYPAKDLNEALKIAANAGTGSREQPFLMLCSKFMTLTGRYSAYIMLSVRTLGVISMVLLACFISVSATRRRGGGP